METNMLQKRNLFNKTKFLSHKLIISDDFKNSVTKY